jgi:diguanylate cyclase (GGDEF)-like protein
MTNPLPKHNNQIDTLTGLPNRTYGTELVAECCERLGLAQVSGMAIEIAHFGQLNNGVSNKFADKILKLTASRLQKLFPYALCLIRTNGDQFCILFEKSHDVTFEAEKLLDFIRRPFAVKGEVIVLTIKIGITEASDTFTEFGQILQSAELALHSCKQDKEKTGDKIKFFEPSMLATARKQYRLANDLRTSLSNLTSELYRGDDIDEFKLKYQPIIDNQSNTLIGFEALLRWYLPSQHVVPPIILLKIAEDIEQMELINRWVIMRACQDAAKWNRKASIQTPIFVSINIGINELNNIDEFMMVVEAALVKSELAPSLLKFEFKKCNHDKKTMFALLNKIKKLGCTTVLDNFGGNDSTFVDLADLPFDEIKIARSLLHKYRNAQTKGSARQTMAYGHTIQSIITLATQLKRNVGIVGVETEQDLQNATSLGAKQMQGYYFARALSEQDVERYIDKQKGE